MINKDSHREQRPGQRKEEVSKARLGSGDGGGWLEMARRGHSIVESTNGC